MITVCGLPPRTEVIVKAQNPARLLHPVDGYLARANFRQSGDVTEVCALPAKLQCRRNVGGLW